MSKYIPKLLAAYLVLSLTNAASAVEVPLKYVKYPHKPESYYPYGNAILQLTAECPAGKWKMPQLKSEHPLYAISKMGDKERLFIIDRRQAGDSFYNRFYLDANGNNDLTDDPVIDGTSSPDRSGRSSRISFPAVDIKVEVNGRWLPYSFRPEIFENKFTALTESNVRRNVSFRLAVNCCYEGEFQVNARRFRVILGDRNCNGRFNEKFTLPDYGRLPKEIGRIRIYSTGDSLYLSGGEKVDRYDEQVCGDWILVNGKLFEVSISAANSLLTLIPVTEKLAALKLTMNTERLTLYTEDGKRCLSMYRPGEKIMVPQGKYRLLAYEVFRKDDQGDLWLLSASATLESPFITVNESSESVLEFGEPYLPHAPLVNVRSGAPSRCYLTFNVEGQGKEFLTDLRRIAGTKTHIPLSKAKNSTDRPKEPAYRLAKADGEVVSQGVFKYG
jgi:hypothetical protein